MVQPAEFSSPEITFAPAVLQRFVEISPDPICTLTAEGCLDAVNATLVDLLGYSVEQLKSEPLIRFVHPDQRGAVGAAFSDIVQSGEPREVAVLHVCKDGTQCRLRWHAVFDSDTDRVYAIARDVTDPRVDEPEHVTPKRSGRDGMASGDDFPAPEIEAFGGRAATFVEAFSVHPHAMFISDADGRFLNVNERAVELTGYTAAELIGHTPLELDFYTDPARYAEFVKSLEECGRVLDFEVILRFGSGDAAICLGSALRLGSEAEPRYLTVIRDISEQKRDQRLLTQLQFAVDGAPDSVMMIDGDARFFYVNDSACRSLGYEREELLGMQIPDIDPGFPMSRWREAWKPEHRQYPRKLERVHRRKDGSTFPVEITTSVSSFEGVDYACTFARDITERKRAEEDLVRYAHIVSAIGDGISALNERHEYAYVNDVQLRMIGRSREDVLGRHYVEVHGDEAFAEVKPHFDRCLAGEKVRFEKSDQAIGQDPAWLDIRLTRFRLKVDGPWMILWMGRDITGIMQSQERLEIYESLVNASSDILAIVTDDYVCVTANPAYLKALDKPSTQVVGKHLKEFVGEEAYERQLKAVADRVFAGEKVRSTFWREYQGIGRRYIDFEMALLPRLVNGRRAALVNVHDQTAEHQARQELTQALQRITYHVENTPLAVIEWDEAFRVRGWSEHAGELFGWTLEEVRGKHADDWDFIHVDDKERTGEHMRALLEGETTGFINESRNYTKDGRVLYCEWYNSGLLDDSGQLLSIMSLVHDVTVRVTAENELKRLNDELEQRVIERTEALKAAQEELVGQERLAVLGRLTSTVSHELRNPLGTIRSALYVIRDQTTEPNDLMERAFARAERNIVRCDKIIDELLDYTRTRELEIECRPLDSWAQEVLAEFEFPEGIDVRHNFRARVDVNMDSHRMQRCVVNVLTNAVDAMQQDAADAPKRLLIQSRIDQGRVELTFQDSGPGIPQDIIPEIFAPFYSTKGFGVGLGLPIVRQIMEQHRGGVEVTSEEGRGTRVTLWLPLND